MKVLIIYDSVFGNTEKVAQAMGAALEPPIDASVVRVGDVKPEQLAGLDALIVGSPTRAFSATPAIKQFLKSLAPHSLNGVKVAAFDTRIALNDVSSAILPPLVKLFGYAAEPIAKQLNKKGGEPAIAPEGFFVQGSEGPMKEGELERAAAWAKQL